MLFRQLLLAFTTKSQHARATRIFSQMDTSQIHSTIDPLVKMKLLKRQQKQNSIIIHYTYEWRFLHYKSRIHHYCNTTFPNITDIDTKLILGTRNNPNLTKRLVRRSPYRIKRQTTKQHKPAWAMPNHTDLLYHRAIHWFRLVFCILYFHSCTCFHFEICFIVKKRFALLLLK